MTLALSLGLVAWGNAVAYLYRPDLPGDGWPALVFAAILVSGVVVVARVARLSRADLGLAGHALPGVAVAVGVTVVTAAASLAVLRFPPLLGEPVAYAPIAAMDLARLGANVALFLPLGTVLPEELAFRGVLFGLLRRRHGALAAILLSSLAFALWHAAVIVLTLSRTNVAAVPLFHVLGLTVAFAAVFAGGCALAALRLGTRHLAAPVVAHWGFIAALLLGLRSMS